ncbi:MAG TPA: hypothetical protein VEB00_03585 [Clostridia bacterium]|nr:hypothetical protein [Clostridia bacterium]
MGAKNKVIAGDYLYGSVGTFFGSINISSGFKDYPINKDTVDEYEVVDEVKRKSAASAVGRGLVGGLVLGPVGLLAGLSAKSKGIHVVALQFKDGKKSLIEIDDKIYKELIKKLF